MVVPSSQVKALSSGRTEDSIEEDKQDSSTDSAGWGMIHESFLLSSSTPPVCPSLCPSKVPCSVGNQLTPESSRSWSVVISLGICSWEEHTHKNNISIIHPFSNRLKSGISSRLSSRLSLHPLARKKGCASALSHSCFSALTSLKPVNNPFVFHNSKWFFSSRRRKADVLCLRSCV